jgi:hypothetical protein
LASLSFVLKYARRQGFAQRQFEPVRLISGRWFFWWVERWAAELPGTPPGAQVSRAWSWLLRCGWRRVGLVALHE